MPGTRNGAAYAPFASVTRAVVVLRSTWRIATWAPGTICPLESTTLPMMLPVATWAAAESAADETATRATMAIARSRFDGMLIIGPPHH